MPDDLRAWFPLYVADILNSRKCRKMGAEMFGVYMLLLIEQWVGGPLPDDEGDLCEMGRSDWATIQEILQAQFVLHDQGWVNERLVEIWEEQDARRKVKSRAGKAGAKARWGQKAQKDPNPKTKTTTPPKDPVDAKEDGNRIPPANATAMRPQCDPNGNESRGKESKEEKSKPEKKKRRSTKTSEPDVIFIHNSLKWHNSNDENRPKRGYQKITREGFMDVMFATGDKRSFPENLVIETQQQLDTFLES